MRRFGSLLVCVLVSALVACGSADDEGPRTRPEWRLEKGPDGEEYRVVDEPPYTIYYDLSNQVQKTGYDSNGDGRLDYLAHHDGNREQARLLEVDTDFDGAFDRWEHYDEGGALVKLGKSRAGNGREDHWVHLDADGRPVKIEQDTSGDGQADRTEFFEEGRLVRVEADADRDGRVDRWQDWTGGTLLSEEFDTDGDGKPDRRLRYDERGEVLAVERP